MSAHTNARLTRAGHGILTTEDGAAVFQAFAGAVGPAEADANEERLVLVWSAHDGLVDELTRADAIIRAMLNAMTTTQKIKVSAKLESDGVSDDGMVRAHERRAALAAAGAP